MSAYKNFYKGVATVKSSLDDILLNYEEFKNNHSNSILREAIN